MQMAYGVRQGHVEGFRSKKEENISSRAVYVQDCSSGTKKNAEIILPRIIYTFLRKSCPILLGGFPQKVKIQTPIEMKVFGCLIFEGAITSIVNWRVFTETLGKRNLHITGE